MILFKYDKLIKIVVMGFVQDIMMRWDRDHDGQLSFEEFVRAMPGNTLSVPEEENR